MFGLTNKKTDEQDNDQANQRVALLIQALEQAQASIKRALEVARNVTLDDAQLITELQDEDDSGTSKVVEGVFNGEYMIGPDGTEYAVPANYASKSKLVEGDMLKLTIAENGSFIYKQIGPIARQQMIATLARNESTYDWYAITGPNRWKLITAAVTYYHGQPGDEVVILVPKNSHSTWAAVENIIKRNA